MKPTEMDQSIADQVFPDWVLMYIKSGDELGLVLRCQMELESLLDTLIEIILPSPEHLSKMQLNYFLKVQLALSLGLNTKLEKALNFFGTIRNKFAHTPDQKIGKGDAKNLYKALPPETKTMVLDSVKNGIAPALSKPSTFHLRDLPPAVQFFIIWSCVATVVEEVAVGARGVSDRLDRNSLQ